MGRTERVEELDSNDVPRPERQALEANTETSDATTGSKPEMRAE